MKTIRNMFEHLHWSNQRILETLQNMKGENEQINRLFAHILLAEQVWLTRLTGSNSSNLPIWADVSIESCVELANRNNQNFKEFLLGLTDSGLEQIVSYRNSKGIEFKNSVRDILTHVALHGQYHRGQINQLLRANNTEPVILDYIVFRR
ncbi:DinB family protein [Neobacillus sp. MER 74]|uniref:DinB family protein n=1 Tax=unclassified Neobacillus TaxID=2675272 RepID=UPI00203CBD6B|nr:DinB family protein [Neobacillus sp. MER 74]MCM3115500.1 DinB family protein [Neobacillus sp. MER 74]